MDDQTIKVFWPCKDYQRSRAFYQALGSETIYEGDGLTQIKLLGTHLFLQELYIQDWAENFMAQMCVHDFDAWTAKAKDVAAEFGTKTHGPIDEAWGRVLYVWDPSGVLLHFVQA